MFALLVSAGGVALAGVVVWLRVRAWRRNGGDPAWRASELRYTGGRRS